MFTRARMVIQGVKMDGDHRRLDTFRQLDSTDYPQKENRTRNTNLWTKEKKYSEVNQRKASGRQDGKMEVGRESEYVSVTLRDLQMTKIEREEDDTRH